MQIIVEPLHATGWLADIGDTIVKLRAVTRDQERLSSYALTPREDDTWNVSTGGPLAEIALAGKTIAGWKPETCQVRRATAACSEAICFFCSRSLTYMVRAARLFCNAGLLLRLRRHHLPLRQPGGREAHLGPPRRRAPRPAAALNVNAAKEQASRVTCVRLARRRCCGARLRRSQRVPLRCQGYSLVLLLYLVTRKPRKVGSICWFGAAISTAAGGLAPSSSRSARYYNN